VGTSIAASTLAGLVSMGTGTDLVRIPIVVGVSMARAAYVELDRSANRIALLGGIAEQLHPIGPR
jgi:hypothetical protein